MRKILGIIALFVFASVLMSVAHAEPSGAPTTPDGPDVTALDDSTNDAGNDGSSGASDDASETTDGETSDTVSDASETTTSDAEDADPDDTADPTEDSGSETSEDSSETSAPCVIPPEVYKELLSLEKQLRERHSAGGDVTGLQSKIDALNARIRAQRAICLGDAAEDRATPSTARNRTARTVENLPATAVAVGRICETSPLLMEQMKNISLEYRVAIESKDFDTARTLREKRAGLEESAQVRREACMATIVPGIIKKDNRTCEIPQGLYDELEKARYRVSEVESLNQTVSAELRNMIANLENSIARHKARCNALNVTGDVSEADVAKYYRQRMVEEMDNEDIDAKVQSLKELRGEIDETVKNMLEQKKRLKYSEMEGIVDTMEFKAGKVKVGDSETEATDVEVEIEDDERNGSLNIKSTKLHVLLSQEGYNVSADNITVNDSGIYVNGALVKALPAAVYQNNKNLERNADRIITMKLAQEGNKAVYLADYDVKKRVLGIIPAKAQYSLKIDAENGETIQEKKPWWTALSTTVRADKSDTASLES